MNLRQKIKKAKKELHKLDRHYDHTSTWGIMDKMQQKIKLQNLINSKRNFNTYYREDEQYKIDWRKLTYISFNADFTELGILKSPNGKPLKKKDIEIFIHNVAVSKLLEYAKKVANENKREGGFVPRVDYFFAVSNDKTKNKRLHREMIAYQFVGDDKIYYYEK